MGLMSEKRGLYHGGRVGALIIGCIFFQLGGPITSGLISGKAYEWQFMVTVIYIVNLFISIV